MSTKYMSNPKTPKVDFDNIGLGKKLDSQIARETGVPRRRVAKERAKRGIEAYTKANPGAKIDRNRRVDASQPATKPITQVVAQSPILSTPKTPKVEKKVRLKNYIAVVLDKSGSIQGYGLEDKLREAYNGLVDTIKQNAKDSGQDTSFSLFQFSGRVDHSVIDTPAEKVDYLTKQTYRADGGSTALFDAVGAAIGYLKGQPDAKEKNVSHLVIVLTDGEENASQTYKPDQIYSADKKSTALLNLITEVQYEGNWTLAFQLPHGFKKKFSDIFKIPGDNVKEWDQTDLGVKETFEKTSGGVTNYFVSRAAGQTSVQKFYATTDLSRVKPKDIHAKLDDVSDRFKAYTLDKEEDISAFVERKTHKKYVIGGTYYQLFKKEKIQKTKKVVIQELGKKSLWTGNEARKLIGLPDDKDVHVTPGNHSGYKVFVQSTSTNRKLPRGTEILVDLQRSLDDVPTWDSSKVAGQ